MTAIQMPNGRTLMLCSHGDSAVHNTASTFYSLQRKLRRRTVSTIASDDDSLSESDDDDQGGPGHKELLKRRQPSPRRKFIGYYLSLSRTLRKSRSARLS